MSDARKCDKCGAGGREVGVGFTVNGKHAEGHVCWACYEKMHEMMGFVFEIRERAEREEPMNKYRGPYTLSESPIGFRVDGPNGRAAGMGTSRHDYAFRVKIMNAAWVEGFKAGQESAEKAQISQK